MKDVYFINGTKNELPNSDTQLYVEIEIPGFGLYKYQDGTLFYSFRSSSPTKSSKIAFNVHLTNGNAATGDNKMYLNEDPKDGETFVTWYNNPETSPPWAPKNRYFYPFLNPASVNFPAAEIIYKQFFGPYIWVGVQ